MMHLIDDNKDFSLLSSRITKYVVYEDDGLICMDLYFRLVYPKGLLLKMTFKDVKEYSFYWNSNYYHGIIENFKYIQHDGLHYISFDPDEEVDAVSEADQDFILCSDMVIEKSIVEVS